MPPTINTSGLQNGVYRSTTRSYSENNDTVTRLERNRTGSGFQKPRTENGIDKNRRGSSFHRNATGCKNNINRTENAFEIDGTENGFDRNRPGSGYEKTQNGLDRDNTRSGFDLNRTGSGLNRSRPGSGLNRSRPGSGRVSPICMIPPSPTGSEVHILPGQLSGRSSVISIHFKGEEDSEYVRCCAPETSTCRVVGKLLACVLAGILFGWCMEKSRVFEPASIRLQMVFRRWIMLKMFLGAVASGQVIMGLLSLLSRFKAQFHESLEAFATCFAEKKGILTSTLGPFILGSGMTLSGACPGMVLAQVGSWANNTVFTLIGCLTGALVYGLVGPYITSLTKPRKPFKKHTIHHKLGVPYAALALPMSGLLIVTVFLMEWFIPWNEDLEYYNRNDFDLDSRNLTEFSGNLFTAKSWPPSVAGVFIGLLQVVIIFSVTDTLGGSSSYVTVVSQWVVTDRLQEYFPYLASARKGIGNWWQVFYVCGAVLGGLFSSLASSSLATTKGPSILTALFGGLMMLLGARLGAGCTSGHGLSGMGLLFWLSMLAVPAMFAGGIVTAFAMDATGALTDWSCHQDYQWMCDLS